MRQNAIETGNKKIADKILLKQIVIEKEELKNQCLAVTDYYKNRYNVIERMVSGLRFLGSILSGLIWGHGLKVKNLITSGLLAMIFFALLIYKYGTYAVDGNAKVPIDLTLPQSLYLSIITFTTLGYGDFTPTSIFAYFICAIESFFGIIFLGFLAATVYRKYSR